MRNFQLETMFTGQDLDLDPRIAHRVGGVGGGPVVQRAGGAFDGTGQSPSGPGNANIADHDARTDKPRGKKSEGAIIRLNPGGQPTGPEAKRRAEAEAQARHGVEMMGTKPRGGGLRPV